VEPCDTSSEPGEAVSVKLGGGGVVLPPLPPPQPAASIAKQQIANVNMACVFVLFFFIENSVFLDCIVRRAPKRFIAEIDLSSENLESMGMNAPG
jgi:hypothetical protein